VQTGKSTVRIIILYSSYSVIKVYCLVKDNWWK